MSNLSEEIWDIKKCKRVKRPKKMENFINEIIEIMKKYNFSLSHEDTHGCFIIEKYEEYNINWLKDAFKNY